MKVKENELKSIINRFDNYLIKIVFNFILKGKIRIDNCIYKYKNRNKNIKIKDIEMKNIFNIETEKILRDKKFRVLKYIESMILRLR